VAGTPGAIRFVRVPPAISGRLIGCPTRPICTFDGSRRPHALAISWLPARSPLTGRPILKSEASRATRTDDTPEAQPLGSFSVFTAHPGSALGMHCVGRRSSTDAGSLDKSQSISADSPQFLHTWLVSSSLSRPTSGLREHTVGNEDCSSLIIRSRDCMQSGARQCVTRGETDISGG
jgi:hypothetical protein